MQDGSHKPNHGGSNPPTAPKFHYRGVPMAPSLGTLIAQRAQRDPKFKQDVLKALRKRLAKATPSTPLWRNLSRAIVAFEKMK